MKIALIGSRGIPAGYSGFETFYEQLGIRLAARGHAVTVYNRSHFVEYAEREYRGVRLVRLPSVSTKHLDTITHTFCSTVHALTQRYDIAYYCIVGNSPLAWLPRLVGTRTVLNVDGEDWAREKWGRFARRYQLLSERIATRTANVIVADAKGIRDRYRRVYGVDTVFVPYGANLKRDEGLDALNHWGLEQRRYILYVGRLVPENAVDLLISAYRDVRTDMPLVIVGDAPFMEDYKAALRHAADHRVIFTGYAFGADYAQLSSHAYLYVQPSAIEGTRPALLDQMGFGNCVVVRGSGVNREVVEDFGFAFDQDRPRERLAETLQALVDQPAVVDAYRAKVRRRIEDFYNWEWVTEFYENLFRRMLERQEVVSYEEFIIERRSGLYNSGLDPAPPADTV